MALVSKTRRSNVLGGSNPPTLAGKKTNMEIDETIELLHGIKEDYLQTPGTSVLDTFHRHYPIVIKEGLIKTYPAESVVLVMSHLFDLYCGNSGYGKNGQIKLKKDEKESSDFSEDRIIIVLNPVSDNLIDGINNHMLKYGWFMGEENENPDGSLVLVYEKKYGDRYSVDDILKKPGDKYLYHITSSKVAEKIKRQGFVPKSHTEFLIADKGLRAKAGERDRVYFFIERPSDFEVVSWGGMAVDRSGGVPTLITIDPEAIDKKVSFFVDPRWRNGVFTYEPISPSSIVNIETFGEIA